MSFAAAPPPDWIPNNMILLDWNVKEAVPQEVQERYDIVHIRNFLFVLMDDEVPDVLQRLIRLLSACDDPFCISPPGKASCE